MKSLILRIPFFNLFRFCFVLSIIILFNSSLIAQNTSNFVNLKGKPLVDSLLRSCDKFHGANEEKAEKYANLALLEAKRIKYHKGELNAMISLINSLNHFSRYDKAIKLNLKAIDFAEKHHFEGSKPRLYNSLATTYLYIRNFKLAIKFYRDAEDEYKIQKRKSELGNIYNNIAVCYDNQEILDSALIYYNIAFTYYFKSKNKVSLGLWYMNVGDLFRKQDKFIEAINYQFKAEKYLLETNDLQTLVVLYNGLAMNFLNQKDGNKALKYILLAKDIGLKINSTYELANVYYSIYEIYKFKKDLKNQLFYIVKYVELMDKIYSVESVKSINEMQEKYENDKKLKEIQLLNKDKKLQELKLSKFENSRNFLIGIVFLVIIILLILIISIRNKNKTNSMLKQQKEQIVEQKLIVEQKNKKIIDSLTYAKRIQDAILPKTSLIKEILKDSFILYKPKDIVAGDFYWMEDLENLVLFAVADCTGHGVPGAMVSVICNNGLNRAVREFGLTIPNLILDKTREIIISEFEKSTDDVKDGMDISLCALNKKTNVLQWAGANNPLWLLRNNEIIEYKADKQPIGKHKDSYPFSCFNIQLIKDDILFIFTDGFHDQFGGPKEKKYLPSKMKELFLSISNKTMDEQRNLIDLAFEKWKGELEQIDDVCILGIRI